MRELEGTLTRKGQVTIPAAIRSRLGLKPRDKVRFTLDGDLVTLQPAASTVLRGYGSVRPQHRPEDWRQVRAAVEQAAAEDVATEA